MSVRGSSRWPERLGGVQALVVALAVFGALITGRLVALNPFVWAIVFVALIVLTALVFILVRFDLIPSRPIDLAVTAPILFLPVTPFVTEASPAGSFMRFAIAAAVAFMIFIRAVPVQRPLLDKWCWIIVIFVAFQLVPLLLSGISFYSLVRAANWVMFIPFAFIKYDFRSLRMALAAALSAAVMLVVGVGLQFADFMQGTWGGLVISGSVYNPLLSERATRYTSFLLNPNDLGLFMVSVGIMIYLISQRLGISFLKRTLGLFGVGVSVLIVLMTASRGAILAALLVLVLMTLVGKVKLVAILAFTCFTTVFLAIALVPSQSASFEATIESISTIASGQDYSTSARLQVWDDQLSGAGNPIIGAGYGGYTGGVQRFSVGSAEERHELYRSLTVDNSWLKLWLEQGIVGVGLVATAIAGAVLSCFQANRKFRNAGFIVAALLVALAFRSLSADVLDVNPWNFFLWLLVGIGFSLPGMSMCDSRKIVSVRG